MDRGSRAPETLAERFWSLARGMEQAGESNEPVAVVAHVLAVLDALGDGQIGHDLTANTVSFLALLRQHEVKGDLLYASPEQARGESVDERSLVFSVGVLLFEKLTGRHPFGADGNPQRLARIRRGEMASGVNYFPKVPAELRTVLVKAMGPFPEERYTTLADLRAELELFVDRAHNPQKYQRVRERERAARATLPALPEMPPGARDDDPTQLLKRPERSRAGRGSGEASVVVGEANQRARASEPPPVPAASARAAPAAPGPPIASVMIDGPEVFRAPPRRGLPPVAWMAIGAAAASILFLALGDRDGGGASAPGVPAAREAEASAARTPPTSPTSPGSSSALAAGASPTSPAARAPTPPAARAPTPPAARAPTPPAEHAAPPPTSAPPTAPGAAFDPEVGGQLALEAARRCIAPDRKVQFGASLLYQKGTGRASKVYYAGTKQLDPAELRCLGGALRGLTAGQPPAVTTPVSYDFRFAPGGDHVKARVERPR